ncbi:MAG TPA: NlpC/P60 family protein, partial [Arachidicoccus sp.]
MQKVIAIVPVAPMRAEASHRAEMVSQMLLGEIAEVIEVGKDFTQIKTELNAYEGWVQNAQLTPFLHGDAEMKLLGFAKDNGTILFNGQPMFISIGTPVFDIKHLGQYAVDYSSIVGEKGLSFSDENLKAIAFKLLNTAYLWGGRAAFGIDCSGYAQLVYKFFDVFLPRDTYQQATVGETIDFLEQSRLGDLAYFDNADGRIIHVGILLDEQTIVHSSGKVRIDKIDAQGIVNVDTG